MDSNSENYPFRILYRYPYYYLINIDTRINPLKDPFQHPSKEPFRKGPTWDPRRECDEALPFSVGVRRSRGWTIWGKGLGFRAYRV